MIFTAATLNGCFVIDGQSHRDDRGFFARTMCRDEFAAHGLAADFVQANHSFNYRRGTLRGLHLQRPPHLEAKLMRCIRGASYNVVVDLRPDSPTYMRWEGFELSLENGRQIYVPGGCANGYQTLADDVDVIYQVTHVYTPAAEAGIRFDDPAFSIAWPEPVTAISDKDRSWPLYRDGI
ncbi:MAG: dTDP-4-dehydrorhamnose 3,5-epimerase [Afipia sp.]|nr:dTDP-4-dehydrorhamnose 3,5-epimerase [Afipia sp.]